MRFFRIDAFPAMSNLPRSSDALVPVGRHRRRLGFGRGLFAQAADFVDDRLLARPLLFETSELLLERGDFGIDRRDALIVVDPEIAVG